MKKTIICIICLIFTIGCSCENNKAADAVEKYLNEYKGLSNNVLKNIDEVVKNENVNEEQSLKYKDVLKRQYRDLIYTIENEYYDGDSADITVKITVYDLYKVERESIDYLNNNPNEFITDGAYDINKYVDYKLDKMKTTNDMISYTVVFKTNNLKGKWEVEQPDEIVIQKIHGIYNYD